MTKEELLILEKILEKIDKADEMNCKKEEEYNSFCTNTREDWNEEQYQKLKREKILTEAAYLASLVELKAEVKNMLNQSAIMRWYTNNTSVIEDKYGNKMFGKVEPKLRKNDGFMAFDVAMFCKDELDVQIIYI